MFEEVLRNRLSSLYVDLTCTGEEAETLVNFMTDSIDDKTTVLRDMYYHNNSPVKVLNPSYNIKGGKKDIEAEIIAVSEGYDIFIKKISCKTSNVLSKHSSALELFLAILTLPDPYARILYLRFFKGMTIEDVSNNLFISRSSCYRKQEKAISLLNDRLEKRNS